MTDTNRSPTGTVQEIMAEHRRCGPGFDGCYSHWPTPHCRADGMAWPCDVDAIRAAIGPHTHAPGDTDKLCAECYRVARSTPAEAPADCPDLDGCLERMSQASCPHWSRFLLAPQQGGRP